MTMPFLTSHSTSTLPEYLRNREVFQKLNDTQLFYQIQLKGAGLETEEKQRLFFFKSFLFYMLKYCSNLFTISIQEFCIKVNNFLKLY